MHPFIEMSLAFDLADKHIITEKPFDIFGKSAGSWIKRSEAVFYLASDRITAYTFLFDVFHQMLESDIILYKTGIMRVLYLNLFSYTGADKGKFIGNSHFLTRIDRRAHKRALHGEQLGKELGQISLKI